MKQRNIIIIISTFVFVMFIGGISYSYFTYNKSVGDVSLTAGEISINLSGVNGDQTLSNIAPLSDINGKTSSDYFDFTVNATVDTERIYYEVYIIPDSENTLNVSYLKTYLTDQSENVINDVTSYENLADSEKENGKAVYMGIVETNNGTSRNETKNFRLRLWIDESYNELTSKTFDFDIYLYAKNVDDDFVIPTFRNIIAKNVSQSYIASYDALKQSNQNYLDYTTQDQVSTNAPKQTVYYYTGDDAAANANVLFAGYCWQIVRTTDNGGVRMIYNGVAQKPVTASTPISDTDITYTNDGTYAYTYNSATKKWTSANVGQASTTDTFTFTVNTAGDYAINYKVSSQANNDYGRIYINNVKQVEYSGEMEGTFDLGTLTPTDTIKIEYYKNASTNAGDDNIIFDIASVNSRSENLACAADRRTTGTKGINGVDGTTQSMSAATRYGRSFDYDLATGEFTLQETNNLPTAWTTSDNNSNGTEDYKELIGTYTCLSNLDTCTTLYYVGSINQSNTAQAYVAKYTIRDVTHFSQMGTSLFNSKKTSPALNGYMFNTEYDYKSQTKSGEYFTTATWNGTTYDLTSGNNGSAPDVEHHYICDSDCTKVRYYYYSTNYYILLENGATVEDAIYKMTGNGTPETKAKAINANYELNNYNSAMKGYLDNWYKKNLTTYASYLDNTSVYCNDRSIRELGGWNPTNSPSLTTTLQFYQYSSNRDLNCVNEENRFAVTNSKAELTYPIGLLTEPERNLMTSNFAKTGRYYWEATPTSFHNVNAYVRYVSTTGDINGSTVDDSNGVRGVVTLKPGTKLENGSGTYIDPYIVGPIVDRSN